MTNWERWKLGWSAAFLLAIGLVIGGITGLVLSLPIIVLGDWWYGMDVPEHFHENVWFVIGVVTCPYFVGQVFTDTKQLRLMYGEHWPFTYRSYSEE